MTDQIQNDMFGQLCEARSMVGCTDINRKSLLCVCSLVEGHDGNHYCRHCAVWYASAPPTGPEAPIPTKEDNQYRRYLEWRETDDGQKVWEMAKADLRIALKNDEKRWSPRDFACRLRSMKRVQINNTFTAWLADDLVVAIPESLDLIERRARKKAKE